MQNEKNKNFQCEQELTAEKKDYVMLKRKVSKGGKGAEQLAGSIK